MKEKILQGTTHIIDAMENTRLKKNAAIFRKHIDGFCYIFIFSLISSVFKLEYLDYFISHNYQHAWM